MTRRAADEQHAAGTGRIFVLTLRLSNALAEHNEVSVVLMRRLIPSLFYPGRDRVGRPVNKLDYAHRISVFDGIDWFWGLNGSIACNRCSP